MKLSLYTLLFERKGQFYLYNSESEFFSIISEDVYEKLHDGAFGEMQNEFIDILKVKKIIVDDDHIYDYYNSLKLNFLSSIGITDSLNLIIAPTTGCNFACPYCFEGEKKTKVMTSEIVAKLITFINGYTSVKKLNLTWYGGEPLMAFNKIKYIVDKIKKECNAQINSQTIITNAYLLSDK